MFEFKRGVFDGDVAALAYHREVFNGEKGFAGVEVAGFFDFDGFTDDHFGELVGVCVGDGDGADEFAATEDGDLVAVVHDLGEAVGDDDDGLAGLDELEEVFIEAFGVLR